MRAARSAPGNWASQAEPGGVLLGPRGKRLGTAGGPLDSLLGDDPCGVTVGLKWAQDPLTVDRPGGPAAVHAPAAASDVAAASER